MSNAPQRFADSSQSAGFARATVRSAAATLGSLRRSNGSGALADGFSQGSRTRLAVTTLALAVLASVVAFAALASGKGVVGYFGNTSGVGTLGGQFNSPRDIAVNSSGVGPADPGDIYVVDQGLVNQENNRIQRFAADGSFVSAWGANVLTSSVNESQKVTVDATGGTFTLSFEGATTGAIAENATAATVTTALRNLTPLKTGGVLILPTLTVSGSAGGPWTINFTNSHSATNVGQITGNGTNLTGGTASVATETLIQGSGAYQICTVAANCKAAKATGAPNAADNAKNGSLDNPQSIAIDGDTGNLYVTDRGNFRVNVYDGVGNFIRSFGWNVDQTEAGIAYEVCPAANRCRSGYGGAGVGQLSTTDNLSGLNGIAVSPADGQAAVGSVFVADTGNRRVNTYALDGTLPSSFGSSAQFGTNQPRKITVDSRGIVYASNSTGGFTGTTIERYDTKNANGGGISFLAPISAAVDEIQTVQQPGGAGFNTNNQFTLTCPNGETTDPFFTSNNASLLAALEAKCGAGNFIIIGAGIAPGVTFVGAYAETDVPTMTCTVVVGPEGGCSISMVSNGATNGAPGALLPASAADSTSGLAIDPDLDGGGPEEDVLQVLRDPANGNTVVQQFGPINDPGLTAAPTVDDERHATEAGFTAVQGLGLDDATGRIYVSATNAVSTAGSGHRVYIVDNSQPPTATIDSVSDISSKGGKINGTINPNTSTSFPNPPPTAYRVEFKPSSGSVWTTYGSESSLPAGSSGVPVVKPLFGLNPNTSYDVRLVVTRRFANPVITPLTTFSTLPAPPKIEGFSSSNVTKTSADLTAVINPLGESAKYRFEYGPTPAYGDAAPQPDGEIAASMTGQTVTVHLEGLQGVTYHFRVFAENDAGETRTLDQTFSFYPENCPNSAVRQQTGSGHLPDCRAYELVSPEEAGTINLFAAGAPSPRASNPSRVMIAGNFGTLAGVNAANFIFDPYVSTRTSTGWETNYAGIPAEIAGGVGGQPGLHGSALNGAAVADANLDHILQWRFGPPSLFGEFFYVGTRHYAPYVHGPGGEDLGRFPTNLSEVPGADNPIKFGFAFELIDSPENGWTGDQEISENGRNYYFSTNRYQFAPGGRVEPNAGPGSVYENDLQTGEISIASKLPGTAGGGDIPAESSVPNHFLEVFDSSSDGSHLLIGAPSSCSGDAYFLCGETFRYATAHLYMRVDGVLTYDVSQGKRVNFKGMTHDGRQVYFTSAEQLSADDHDTSIDIFMWSESTDEITRISTSPEGGTFGDSDECAVSWISKCGVEVVPAVGGSYNNEEAQTFLSEATDNSVARDSGDIYFYSPEQLVASNAAPEGKNLYVRRGDGRIEYVATLENAANRAITRIQVTPSGSHAAFLTASPLTSYGNAGQEMVYLFDAEAETMTCMSCLPDGSPPPVRPKPGLEKIRVSVNGSFMSDDGRVFWSTPDPLVPRDTNGEDDVYEYSGGRAQLITTGIGEKTAKYELGGGNFFGKTATLGVRLIGVSADGVDAYFTTNETLVAQDQNGAFQKIYDARTSGGFLLPAEVAPCKAADECHGATVRPPLAPNITSGADLGSGGNRSTTKHKHKRGQGKRAKGKKKKKQQRKGHAKGHQRRSGK